jgi:hypothetical protein
MGHIHTATDQEEAPAEDPELEVATWIDENLSPHPPQVTFSQ